MPLNDKIPEVAITSPPNISQPSNCPDMLSTKDDVDSTRSLSSSPSSPSSPSSQHHTRRSLDVQKSESKQTINVCESDLEACLTDSKGDTQHLRTPCRTKECAVWPGKRTLKAQMKAGRRQRGCNPLRNLGKRTRIWVKILIGLLVVGLAVGIGVGISKAVGGGVWKSSS